MDFTREPIIETVITPRDGYRLVVRSSKNVSQEEHFVDAIEVVSFGHALFFRCLEKPKPFIVPVSDYEIIEVREPRMALKTLGIDGSIKIGGGRDSIKPPKEIEKREEVAPVSNERSDSELASSDSRLTTTDGRPERGKRDRRRHQRRRRGREDVFKEESTSSSLGEEAVQETIPDVEPASEVAAPKPHLAQPVTGLFSSLLPPPTRLIRDDLEKYRNNDQYKGAFFLREDEDQGEDTFVEGFSEGDEEDSGLFRNSGGNFRSDLFSSTAREEAESSKEEHVESFRQYPVQSQEDSTFLMATWENPTKIEESERTSEENPPISQ